MKIKKVFMWSFLDGGKSDKLRESILAVIRKGKKVIITIQEASI